MALKETNTVTVDPGNEDKMRALWETFGWELESKETVRTADSSHLERRGDAIYNVTESGVHYVKMTFRRDPDRKNYAELKSLEEQYYAPLPSHTISPGEKPKKPGVFGLIMTVIWFIIGSFCLLGGIAGGGGIATVIPIIISIVFFIFGIYSITQRKSFSSRLKSWETENEAYQTNHAAEEKALSEAKKKRTDALEKARSLV